MVKHWQQIFFFKKPKISLNWQFLVCFQFFFATHFHRGLEIVPPRAQAAQGRGVGSSQPPLSSQPKVWSSQRLLGDALGLRFEWG